MGRFLVPIVARTTAGYFLDIEPVAVAQRELPDDLVSALDSALRLGNPSVATPTRASFPEPVVLKPAEVKSWATFEKRSICWTINLENDEYSLSATGRAAGGGWADEPSFALKVPCSAGAPGLAGAILAQLESRTDV
jgi:hypothetical protein